MCLLWVSTESDAWQTLSHLIIRSALQRRSYNYPHFADENWKSWCPWLAEFDSGSFIKLTQKKKKINSVQFNNTDQISEQSNTCYILNVYIMAGSSERKKTAEHLPLFCLHGILRQVGSKSAPLTLALPSPLLAWSQHVPHILVSCLQIPLICASSKVYGWNFQWHIMPFNTQVS